MAQRDFSQILGLIERNVFLNSDDEFIPEKEKSLFMEPGYNYRNKEKRFFLEIYHGNLNYLKKNHEIIQDYKLRMMCFCVAVSFSDNIDLIKFLMNCFDIDQVYYHYAKSTWYNYLIPAFEYNQSLDIIKFIINDLKYSINFKSVYGKNCMNYAIKNPNVQIIKYLVSDHGMNPHEISEYSDSEGWLKRNLSNLNIASESNTNPMVIEYLLTLSNDNDLLNQCIIHAMHGKNVDVIKYLLETFPDILSHTDMDAFLSHSDIEIIKKIIPSINHFYSLKKILYSMRNQGFDLSPGWDCHWSWNAIATEENLRLIIESIWQNNVLMLDNKALKIIEAIDPFDNQFDFDVFVENVKKLTCKVPLRGSIFRKLKYVDEKALKKRKIRNKNRKIDFRKRTRTNTILNTEFSDTDTEIYETRKKMKRCRDSVDPSDMSSIYQLSDRLGKLYVNFLHTGKIDIDQIVKDDIMKFLQFIDKYETLGLNPIILEDKLIKYFEKNIDFEKDLELNKYLEYMCFKYKLKNMYLYLWIKNKIDKK